MVTTVPRPSVEDISALLPARAGGQFTTTTRPSIDQVEATIDGAGDELDAEFVDGDAIPDSLQPLATFAIRLNAASMVELGFFPEQETGAADTSGVWYARYQKVLMRLRQLIAEEDGGPVTTRTVRFESATVAAARRLFESSGTVTNGAWIVNDFCALWGLSLTGLS